MKRIKRYNTKKVVRTTLLLIVLSFLLGASDSSVDKNNTKSISKTQATGEIFGNGVLSASRIEDYQPGSVGSQKTDPKNRIYTVVQYDH